MSDHESGHFSTGFSLGLLAGAAGYFVFGTNKGKEFRVELSKKWQEAKKVAADEWPKEAGAETIGDFLKTMITQISSEIADSTGSKKHPKRKKKPTNKKQFKGI
ncbi:MAG: hypothetical protein COY80_02160 [Candidatus Pacebacteria bacterium CG_4_10_14_0_8_um_filter_42_14]|nr:MAG: hypothetical protein COY80_02160 [Candidatus Pacebacteria bacterium CG_4_10_14_0_8_um_filter_42_14]